MNASNFVAEYVIIRKEEAGSRQQQLGRVCVHERELRLLSLALYGN